MAGTRSLFEALENHALKTRVSELEAVIKTKEEAVVSAVAAPVIKEITVVEEKIKVVEKIVDRPIEIIKEVEKFISTEIHVIPKWVFGVITIETLLIIALLLKH